MTTTFGHQISGEHKFQVITILQKQLYLKANLNIFFANIEFRRKVDKYFFTPSPQTDTHVNR